MGGDRDRGILRPMRESLPVGAPVEGRSVAALERAHLRGRDVELMAVEAERDCADLFAAAHGSPQKEEVWTYMAYGPFADEAAMHGWLEECAAAEDTLFYSVRDRHGGRAVGMASLLAIEPTHRHVEVGNIWYGPDAQRGTTNTETVQLLLREAFECGYRRVEWKCDALNERSRNAALRLGFRFEGVFRQHMVVKGRNRDTAWFSMLSTEWPAAEAAMQRWLAWQGGTPPPLASLRAG